MEFKLGDYVIVNEWSGYKGRLGDTVGKIVAIREYDYVVYFEDSRCSGLHGCEIGDYAKHLEEYYHSAGTNYLRLNEPRGLYLDEDDLELINKKKGNSRLFR